jgi:hypothetical protein
METFEIEGKILHLAFPDELKFPWIGEKQYIKQIQDAWIHERDSKQRLRNPFNPKILGRCGMGKTTLAYSAAKLVHSNPSSQVFILHCSEALQPEDVLIHQVKKGDNIEYHASSLITAMIKGAMCIIDECQYLSHTTWAAISTLFEQRYVVSELAGLKIHADENFHLCLTQSYFDSPKKNIKIPEYISILLKPIININHPSRKHEFEVLSYYFPEMNQKLIHVMVDFLQTAHFEERPYSIRDCINIIQKYESYNASIQNPGEIDWNLIYQSIRQILDNQAIYFLNDLISQTKNSDPLFKKDDFQNPGELGDDDTSEITDFFEDEDNYAEFIEDEELDDFDDSLTIFDEDDESPNEDVDFSGSFTSDTRYIKKVRKKIRSKLKEKKKDLANRKS